MTQHKNYFHVATSRIYIKIYEARSAACFFHTKFIRSIYCSGKHLESYAGDARGNVHRPFFFQVRHPCCIDHKLKYNINNIYYSLLFVCLAQQPPVGQGLLIHEVSKSHTTTKHSR